jgi:AcrR family transcriptional regulator
MTVREAHRDLTRNRILDAAIAVLTRGGEELTMAAVAEEASVTERTVFRHFETREKLFEAVWHWINIRLAVAGMPQSVPDLLVSPRNKFPRFDADEALFRWFVANPQGHAVRLTVKAERQASYLALVRRARPDLGRAAQRRLAAACQLLDSSFAWQSMHDYWDMDGAEGGRAASEAIAVLLQSSAEPNS